MGPVTTLAPAVTVALAACTLPPPDPRPAPDPPPSTRWDEAVAWRWEPPPSASVGMPAADGDGVAATYGHARLIHVDTAGRVEWDHAVAEARDVAPLLLDGLAVAATEVGLVAVDRATGAHRWSAAAPDRVNTPVGWRDRIVATTWDGTVLAVAAGDGTEAWRTGLPGPSLGPPATGRGVVVATWDTGEAAGMTAFDAATGEARWEEELFPAAVSSPAVVGDLAVAVAGDRTAVAVDLRSGARRWTAPTAGGAGSPEVPPLPVDGAGVLVADRLTGLSLHGADGSVRWRGPSVGAAVRGGPAGPDVAGRFALPVDDGRLLLAGPGQEPVVLDPPGRVSGVAGGGRAGLVVATEEAAFNALVALRPSLHR
jgi:outer membrane protein assembly factor BamB